MKAEQIDISWWSFAQNPYDYYDFLKTKQGVNYLPKNKGWIITSYDEIVSILNQPQRFSSEGENSFDPILLNCDPPKHTAHRKVIAGERGVFSNTRISELYQTNQEIAKALIEPLKEKESFDLLSEFAIPFSSLVILKILGFNEDILESVKEWSASAISSRSIHDKDYSNLLWKQLEPKLKIWVAESSNSKAKDGVNEFLQSPILKKNFSDETLLHLIKVILLGGNETTPNLVSSTLLYLLNNPKVYARIKADYSLIDNLVNEVLRVEAPTQIIQRNCTEDVLIAGQKIAKGSLIYLALGAANRDEKIFENAKRIDIDRPKKKILSFGFGPHYCLGAHLAKQEAKICIELLLTEFPELNLLSRQSFAYHHSSHVRGLKKLWLKTKESPRISIAESIEKAIKLLQKNQLDSGEFPTYEYYPTNPELESKGWHISCPSPFIHANVALSLQKSQVPKLTENLNQAINFLRNQKEVGEVWRFWKIDSKINNVPPDIDDTSLASYVLEKMGVAVNNKNLLTKHIRGTHVAYTWLKPSFSLFVSKPMLWLKWKKEEKFINKTIKNQLLDYTDFELGVMANLLLYLGETDDTRKIVDHCIGLWKEKNDPSHYYQNKWVKAYHVSRAYSEKVPSLLPIAQDIINDIKQQKDQLNYTDLLLCALSVKNFNTEMQLLFELKQKLVDLTTQRDFEFPELYYFTSKDRNYHAGSKALLAAWYLELMYEPTNDII